MLRANRLLVAGLGAAAILVGCGGGSSSSSSSGFAAKADAACKKGSDQALAADNRFTPSAAGAVTLMTAYETAIGQEISTLRSLTPPASTKAVFNAFIADLGGVSTEFENAKTAAQSNNLKAYNAAQNRIDAKSVVAYKQAASAGLTLCAGKLPAADVAALTTLVVAGAVHPTASMCRTSMTQAFLNSNYRGSVAVCEREFPASRVKSAQVTAIYGILPSATIYLTQSARSVPHLELTALKVSGVWKIDQVRTLP